MSRTVCLGLLAVASILLLPLLAQAEGAKKPDLPPQGPGVGGPKPAFAAPESLFYRLDRNKDGVITAEEVPEGAPEPLKQWLKKADSNGDRKISRDELAEAFKAHGPPMRPGAGVGPPRDLGRGPAGPLRRAEVGPKPDLARPEVLFKHLDKNGDGVLNLDEFAAGIKEFRQRIQERMKRRLAGGGYAGRQGWRPGRMARHLGPSQGPPVARWGQSWGSPRPWRPGPWAGPGFGPRPEFMPPRGPGGPPGLPLGPPPGWASSPEPLRAMIAAMVREELHKALAKPERVKPGPKPPEVKPRFHGLLRGDLLKPGPKPPGFKPEPKKPELVKPEPKRPEPKKPELKNPEPKK